MEKKVLVAEPCDITRAGIKAIFIDDTRVSCVYEAETQEEAYMQIHSRKWDLVVINQSLIKDTSILSSNNIVILTTKPDIIALQTAYKYGARAYLLESVSAELLRTTLLLTDNTFLIEPALTAWILESPTRLTNVLPEAEVLTPREHEIVGLLRSGIRRSAIARQLHISEATLKTHIRNITRKYDSTQLLMPHKLWRA